MSKEDNKDFIEQQNKGFQRSIYWNEYKTKEQEEAANANAVKYIILDPSFQGVNRLFIMAYYIIIIIIIIIIMMMMMIELLEMGKQDIIYQELT